MRSSPGAFQILLVEDSPEEALLAQEAFRDSSTSSEVHVADNGAKALRFVKNEAEYAWAPRPDLILLDLNLPIKDGREVLGVDEDEETVQSLHGVLSHVVRADTTNEDALRQLAVPDFDRAVVGIGSHVEASILTACSLHRGMPVASNANSTPPSQPSSVSFRSAARLITWKPPESVRMGPCQSISLWRPPRRATRSAPGRSMR